MKPAYRVVVAIVAVLCILAIVYLRPKQDRVEADQVAPAAISESTPAQTQQPPASPQRSAPSRVASPAAQTPATNNTSRAHVPTLVLGDGLQQYPASVSPHQPAAPLAQPARIVPPRPADAPAPTGGTYTIRSGETFSSIARRLYGSESRWVDIAQANPLVDPRKIKAGQVIKLPLPGHAPAGTVAPEPVIPIPTGQDKTYTVRSGDSLTSIATQHYGDPRLWNVIYQANRQAIGKSPDSLKAGTKLRLPAAMTPAH